MWLIAIPNPRPSQTLAADATTPVLSLNPSMDEPGVRALAIKVKTAATLPTHKKNLQKYSQQHRFRVCA